MDNPEKPDWVEDASDEEREAAQRHVDREVYE